MDPSMLLLHTLPVSQASCWPANTQLSHALTTLFQWLRLFPHPSHPPPWSCPKPHHYWKLQLLYKLSFKPHSLSIIRCLARSFRQHWLYWPYHWPFTAPHYTSCPHLPPDPAWISWDTTEPCFLALTTGSLATCFGQTYVTTPQPAPSSQLSMGTKKNWHWFLSLWISDCQASLLHFKWHLSLNISPSRCSPSFQTLQFLMAPSQKMATPSFPWACPQPYELSLNEFSLTPTSSQSPSLLGSPFYSCPEFHLFSLLCCFHPDLRQHTARPDSCHHHLGRGPSASGLVLLQSALKLTAKVSLLKLKLDDNTPLLKSSCGSPSGNRNASPHRGSEPCTVPNFTMSSLSPSCSFHSPKISDVLPPEGLCTCRLLYLENFLSLAPLIPRSLH